MRGICKKCGEKKKLTRHSIYGNHQFPYVYVCLDCHKRIHKKPNWRYSKLNLKWIKEFEDGEEKETKDVLKNMQEMWEGILDKRQIFNDLP